MCTTGVQCSWRPDKTLVLPELESQTVVHHCVGAESRVLNSGALNHWAILSSALSCLCYKKKNLHSSSNPTAVSSTKSLCPQHPTSTASYAHSILYPQHPMPTASYAHSSLCLQHPYVHSIPMSIASSCPQHPMSTASPCPQCPYIQSPCCPP